MVSVESKEEGIAMPTRRFEVYTCPVCGNVIEVIRSGGGTLVCCNVEMERHEPNSLDAAAEEHIPVAEAIEGGLRVQVGRQPHPMGEQHHIEWIELSADRRRWRHYLRPDDQPATVFRFSDDPPSAWSVRAACCLHGLWQPAEGQ